MTGESIVDKLLDRFESQPWEEKRRTWSYFDEPPTESDPYKKIREYKTQIGPFKIKISRVSHGEYVDRDYHKFRHLKDYYFSVIDESCNEIITLGYSVPEGIFGLLSHGGLAGRIERLCNSIETPPQYIQRQWKEETRKRREEEAIARENERAEKENQRQNSLNRLRELLK